MLSSVFSVTLKMKMCPAAAAAAAAALTASSQTQVTGWWARTSGARFKCETQRRSMKPADEDGLKMDLSSYSRKSPLFGPRSFFFCDRNLIFTKSQKSPDGGGLTEAPLQVWIGFDHEASLSASFRQTHPSELRRHKKKMAVRRLRLRKADFIRLSDESDTGKQASLW